MKIAYETATKKYNNFGCITYWSLVGWLEFIGAFNTI